MSFNHILPLWKPVSWTSFDVVKKVRSIMKIRKVGHAGTLDPFAEGILVVCTGNKTSEVEKIMNKKKEYSGVIFLGARTSTLDPEGSINEHRKYYRVSSKKLKETKDKFIGRISQTPPKFSALKHNGVPLYKYARKNIEINIPPRYVDVYDFNVEEIDKNKLKFKIKCGRGTYIRSIARDFALELDTVGYLLELKRTKIGNYHEDNSIKIENIKKWLSTKI